MTAAWGIGRARADATRISLGTDPHIGALGFRRLASGGAVHDDADGLTLETFVVYSWGEHERQHSRTTAADRRASARIAALLEPGTSAVTGHFIASEVWEGEPPALLPATRVWLRAAQRNFGRRLAGAVVAGGVV